MVNKRPKPPPAYRHPEFRHVGKVRLAQPPGVMYLGKEHLLARTFQTPPALDLTLERPQLAIGKLPGISSLQRLQQGLGLQAGIYRQLLGHPWPDLDKRVGSGSPGVIHPHLTGKFPGLGILRRRLPIHPSLVRRNQKRLLRLQQRHKSPHLAIRHHALNSLLESKTSSRNPDRKGVV